MASYHHQHHPADDPYQLQQPPYGHQTAPPPAHVPHSYHGPPPSRPPLHRNRYVVYAYSAVRQLSLAVPVAVFILDAWWFGTGRVCAAARTAGDNCYWPLWTTLPIAAATFIWHLASLISARRARHQRRSMSTPVQLGGQSIVSAGATVCFALLIYHLTNFSVDQEGFEGGMIALLVILAIINWLAFAYMVCEWKAR